jgi:hypothetical protein
MLENIFKRQLGKALLFLITCLFPSTEAVGKMIWTQEKDVKFIPLVGRYGKGNWVAIGEGRLGKTHKQCGEHWIRVSDFGI